MDNTTSSENGRQARCSLFQSCLETTTAHGVGHIVRSSSFIQKLIWCIAIFGAMCSFGYYFSQNIVKYLSEPTAVSIELQEVRFEPPDIHICNTKPLSLTRMLESVELNSSFVTDLQKGLIKLDRSLKSSRVKLGKFRYFWSTVQRDKLYSNFGHLVHQTIFSAQLEAEEPITSDAFTHSLSTDYFGCFRLTFENLEEFLMSSKPLNLILHADAYNYGKTNLQLFGNPLESFYFNAAPSIIGPSGMVLVFTASGGFPHQESDYVLIGPGKSTSITLNMHESVSANTKRRPCQVEEEFVEYHNPLLGGNNTIRYRKSLSDCKYKKLIQAIMMSIPVCQCIPYMIPVTLEMAMKYPVCGNLSRATNRTEMERIKMEFVCYDYYFLYDTMFDYKVCASETPCKTQIFSSKATSSDWLAARNMDEIVDKVFIQDLNLKKKKRGEGGLRQFAIHEQTNTSDINDYVKCNFARVSINIGEKKGPRMTESLTYGLENLISDTGGLTGLYLGMSLLTFCEIMNLLHDCFTWRYGRREC